MNKSQIMNVVVIGLGIALGQIIAGFIPKKA